MLRKNSGGIAQEDRDSSDEEFEVLDERDPRCQVLYTHPKFESIFQHAENSELFVKYESKKYIKDVTINDTFENNKEAVEPKDEKMHSCAIGILKEVAMRNSVENLTGTTQINAENLPNSSIINDVKDDSAGIAQDGSYSSDEEFAVLDETDPHCKVLYKHPKFLSIFQAAEKSEIFVNDETNKDVTEVEQEDKERNSQSRKRVSGKENLKKGRFTKVVTEDDEGKEKSSSSEKRLMQRAFNWLLGSFYKRSKKYQGSSKIRK